MIVEGIVGRLENDLEKARLEQSKVEEVKEKCWREVFEQTKFLIEHASKEFKNQGPNLFVLERDLDQH